MIHEDQRRILEDWPEAKIITAKQDCILGGHYHKEKHERFILITGNAVLIIHTQLGDIKKKMRRGILYAIDPFTAHSLKLTQATVILGVCSHPYDPTDDYKI